MSTLNSISDRALDLASSVGDNLKHAVPQAGKWLEAGAKLGALKGGARVAGMIVRRNPAIAIATAAGAGLLWYAARRKARQAESGNGSIEGSSKRVDAKRSTSARKRPARTRTTRGSTASAD
ncbi:hypothetical protein [Lysobacter sp. A3-1-A15]|uniref:hypothetical protein n=1 Tax=Novilysobacter viscosus TaxID=3098602 RepID=UPI002ED81C62